MAESGAGQGYAGDISVEQAYDLLTDNGEAVLVDVRTQAEWAFVGAPDLSAIGKETVFVSWQNFPAMEANSNFAGDLAGKGVTPDKTVLFICRSGQRSKHAAVAMTGAGFKQCFNVEQGFEGPLDGDGHRGSSEGWKAKGLPWVQR